MKWWNRNEYTNSFAEAIELQGEIQKDQLALLFVNTAFAKELNRQQILLREQQTQILEQNEAIAMQNMELKQLSEKSLSQQRTIMKLLELSDGQAEAIRQLLKKADKLQETEDEVARRSASITAEVLKINGELRQHEQKLSAQETRMSTHNGVISTYNSRLDSIDIALRAEQTNREARLINYDEQLAALLARQKTVITVLVVVGILSAIAVLFCWLR